MQNGGTTSQSEAERQQQQQQQLFVQEALKLKKNQKQQQEQKEQLQIHYQQHLLMQEQKILNFYPQFEQQKQQQHKNCRVALRYSLALVPITFVAVSVGSNSHVRFHR